MQAIGLQKKVGLRPPFFIASPKFCLVLAVAAPMIYGGVQLPSVGFYHQFLAFFLWAAVVCLNSRDWLSIRRVMRSPDYAFFGVFFILCVSLFLSILFRGLPHELGAIYLAFFALACFIYILGCQFALAGEWGVFTWVAVGYLIFGLVSVCVSGIQVFCPGLVDNFWVAAIDMPGRAVGNLRQPNMFGVQMAISVAAVLHLRRHKFMPTSVAVVLVCLFVWAIVCSASRTAVICLLVITALAWVPGWGGRSSVLARLVLPIFAACWLLMYTLHQLRLIPFSALIKASGGSDLTSSRGVVYADSLHMLWVSPLKGVGWGRFNQAWAFMGDWVRPPVVYDNAHNLFLHLIVEMGLPLGICASLLIVMVLWGVARSLWNSPQWGGEREFVGLIFVFFVIHSQLEYPLWYGYALFPFVLICGYATVIFRRGGGEIISIAPERGHVGALSTILVAVVGSVVLMDYARVGPVFRSSVIPMSMRIDMARRSMFFGPFGDLGAVLSRDSWQVRPIEYARPIGWYVNTELMGRYAESLAFSGEMAKARQVLWQVSRFKTHSMSSDLVVCGGLGSGSKNGPKEGVSNLDSLHREICQELTMPFNEKEQPNSWEALLP